MKRVLMDISADLTRIALAEDGELKELYYESKREKSRTVSVFAIRNFKFLGFVWEDMRPLGEKTILEHFPHIYEQCVEEGFDPRKEPYSQRVCNPKF